MSRKLMLALGAGTAGALIIGYCIYYDRKRRADPNFKRKVHERRLKATRTPMAIEMQSGHPLDHDAGEDTFGLGDHEILQHYFQTEIKLGEDLFRQGKVDDGLIHLSNAIKLCAQPVALMEVMKMALPEQTYAMLMMKLPELQHHETLMPTVCDDLALD